MPAVCRRVAVVPGVSGTDTATATAGLALALASIQDGEVLLLDADSTLGVMPAGTDLAARLGLVRATPGALLPVAPRVSYHAGATIADLGRDWSNHCVVLIIYCGPGPDPGLLDAALDNSSTLVLVTPDTDSGVASARAALDWLHDTDRHLLADSAVVALAAPDSTSEPAGEPDMKCHSVFHLPADAYEIPPGLLDPLELPEPAQLALLGLADTVVSAPTDALPAASYSPPSA